MFAFLKKIPFIALSSSLALLPAPDVLINTFPPTGTSAYAVTTAAQLLSAPNIPTAGQLLNDDIAQASIAQTIAERAAMVRPHARPKALTIPSIDLRSPIVPVGLNHKGEMDVPDGSTNNVGWYKRGTVPGDKGSAVLDAHVYAAFAKLRDVKVGDDIYVVAEDGEELHFVVRSTIVYRLGELTSAMLFGRRDDRWLNLITCAGKRTADGSTYTHRLVVYATLVNS